MLSFLGPFALFTERECRQEVIHLFVFFLSHVCFAMVYVTVTCRVFFGTEGGRAGWYPWDGGWSDVVGFLV